MKHWKITDPGLVRRENQDAFGFAQLSGGYTVAVVCDGMGGVAGGSIASSVAVETYIRTLSDSDHPDQAVRAAVMAANSAIRQRAAGHPELRSMGTTLVSALVKGDRVLISNVGDSRAYLAGAQGLRQISRDHSPPQSHYPGFGSGPRCGGRRLCHTVEGGGFSAAVLRRTGEYGHGPGDHV